MMYAPVVTRFITYGVPVPNFAGVYMKAVLSHPHVAEWIDKAQDEPWVIEQYESHERKQREGLGLAAASLSGRIGVALQYRRCWRSASHGRSGRRR